MRTTALRLYGEMDLRLESFNLPEPCDDEIVAEVICDSLCMSSYKLVEQGIRHKRAPKDIGNNPIIMGHEFAGKLLKVGRRWQKYYKEGEKFTIQPALDTTASLERPGFSFSNLGGDSTFVLFPSSILETGCLLCYTGDSFFEAALSEPLSCIIGASKNQYHVNMDTYEHRMGIRKDGITALLAGCGPMGLGLLDYLLNGPVHPALVAVTDIDQARLDRAANVIKTRKNGTKSIEVHYCHSGQGDTADTLMKISKRQGYDDVFVLAPMPELIQQADSILAKDGCINFFAGPSSADFYAKINFYNVHYAGTHIVGTSGGNIKDSLEALDLISVGNLRPAIMITHIGGITAAKEATLNLPRLKGGKKIIYTHLDIPLVAVEDMEQMGRRFPLFAELAQICDRHGGLWNAEAETFLLENAPKVANSGVN